MPLPRIHCLTDLPDADAEVLACLDLLAAVAQAGVDGVQVRAKQLTDRALLDLTVAVVERVRRHGTSVLVNDRIDIALAAGADGVHLGLDDLPVHAARALVPDGFLVGATCRHREHAQQARAEGADYVGVGPVYESDTKAGLPAPIGLDVLREVAAVIPAVAISGITLDRVPDVMAAGAHGIAVVGAISRAADPAAAARSLVVAVHDGASGEDRVVLR